jgi:phosphoglycolate phosphatase
VSKRARFDLVIFDLDGTLVDSVPDIAWSLNATLAEAKLPPLSIEEVTRLVGDGAARLVERALPPSEGARDPAPLLARFVANYAGHVCVSSRLYPGVTELCDALSGAEIAAAVLTNKPRALARQLLEALGIADRFRAIAGDGDGFPRKPDPAAALSIITGIGAERERTVIVGDGLPDVRVAHAVPCPVIAASWGYSPVAALRAESPTFMAASVGELWPLIRDGDATRA